MGPTPLALKGWWEHPLGTNVWNGLKRAFHLAYITLLPVRKYSSLFIVHFMSAYMFPFPSAPPVVPPAAVVNVNGFAFGLPGPTVGSAAQPPMKNQQPPMKNQQTHTQPQPQQRQGQRVTPDASLIAARLPPAATPPTPPNVHVDNQQKRNTKDHYKGVDIEKKRLKIVSTSQY